MQAHLLAYLPSAGLSCLAPSPRKSATPPTESRFENEAAADSRLAGPDAYKVAVLLLVGATILTLF